MALSPGLRVALELVEQEQSRTDDPRGWKALARARTKIYAAIVELDGRERAFGERVGVPHHETCACGACLARARRPKPKGRPGSIVDVQRGPDGELAVVRRRA